MMPTEQTLGAPSARARGVTAASRLARAIALMVLLSCVASQPIADEFDEGYAAQKRGDFELAISSYTRALESDSLSDADRIKIYNNRGGALSASGEFQRAIEDFNRAIAINPDAARILYNRGVAQFHLGDFGAAAADLGRAVELDPGNAYSVIWRFLARARAGEHAAAELKRNAAAADLESWPGPIVGWFLGHGTLRDVVGAARDEDFQRQVAKTCEAGFYVGQKLLLDNRHGDAERWFATAVATCNPSFVEYAGARAELAKAPKPRAPLVARSAPAPTPMGTERELEHVATADVNYRRGPGRSYARLGTLPEGTRVAVEARARDWYQIRLDDGSRGFVHEDFLAPLGNLREDVAPLAARRYATGGAVNLRAGPGVDRERKQSLAAGTRLTVDGEAGDWFRVRLDDGTEGFVHKLLLDPVSDTVSTAQATQPGGPVSAPPEASAGLAFETTARVNYRAGPGTQHARLGTLDAGTAVQAHGDSGEWMRIRVEGAGDGYVHRRFLRPVPEPQAAGAGPVGASTQGTPPEPSLTGGERGHDVFVTTARASYRAGPGTDHPRLGVLDAGTAVRVEGVSGDWLQVTVDEGARAYVHRSLLRPGLRGGASPEGEDEKPETAGDASPERLFVTNEPVNYRAGPGTDHPRLGAFDAGTTVRADGESGGWVSVRLASGDRVYVYRDFLRRVQAVSGDDSSGPRARGPEVEASTPRAFVTTAVVNYRSGPGMQFERIGTLEAGATVTVDGRAGAWQRLRLSAGAHAFVHRDFLAARN